MPLLFADNSVLFNRTMSTFSERIAEAAKAVGGQSELARQLTEKTKKRVSQGLVGYLIHGRPDRSPPRSSEMTPWIAEIAGFNVDWLATGRGEKYAAPTKKETPQEAPTEHHRVSDSAELHYHVRTAAPAPDLAGAVEPVPNFMPVGDVLIFGHVSGLSRRGRRSASYRRALRTAS
jgi:hypothetical protein